MRWQQKAGWRTRGLNVYEYCGEIEGLGTPKAYLQHARNTSQRNNNKLRRESWQRRPFGI